MWFVGSMARIVTHLFFFFLSVLLCSVSPHWHSKVSVADWVSTFPAFDKTIATAHLHDGGWGPYQSLEVSYRVQTGQGLWLIIFDELALSIFFGLVGWYTWKSTPLQRTVHKCYPILCAIIAVLLHLGFWFGLLRLVNWQVFMILGAVTSVVSTLILIPVWLIALGRHLHVLQVIGTTNVSLLGDQYTMEMGGVSGETTHQQDDTDDLGERI